VVTVGAGARALRQPAPTPDTRETSVETLRP
jgi:hypothetical protein